LTLQELEKLIEYKYYFTVRSNEGELSIELELGRDWFHDGNRVSVLRSVKRLHESFGVPVLDAYEAVIDGFYAGLDECGQ